MDDATKAYAKPLSWPEPENDPSSPDLDRTAVPETTARKPESADNRKLNNWFLEQRGKKRVPKRLDVPNELLVISGGPLKLTGNITLIDEDGNTTHSTSLKLCRCGASKNKPFCDDKHLDIEFFDNGAVTQISDCTPVKRPRTITVTCVKNGPLRFRGHLRIHNNKGQECHTMSGALCGCGKSSKKPFCDSNHGCSNC